MSEIGKLTPAFDPNTQELIRQWRVSIAVTLLPERQELEVARIYEDEGFLCIDVKLKESDSGDE